MWTLAANPALTLVAVNAQRAEELPAGVAETLRSATRCTASEGTFDLVELVRMPARTYRAPRGAALPNEGLFAATTEELRAWGITPERLTAGARPLTGLTVVVTRAAHQVAPLAVLLEAAGARVVALPAIAMEPPAEPARVDAALLHLASRDAVVFTSENGALYTFERARALGLDARVFAGRPVAAIGPGTAKALAREGLRADLVPAEHIGEALAAALVARLAPQSRIAIFRATEARDALPRLLAEAGHAAEVIPVYTTVRAFDADRFATLARSGAPLAVTFTSASTATSVIDALEAANASAHLAGAGIVSIGPITTEALVARGVRPNAEAKPYTLAGVVDAIAAWYRGSTSFTGA